VPIVTTTVKVSVRGLTAVLGIAAAVILIFGVWPTLLGPSGLDIGGGLAPMPAPRSAPHVVVQPGDGFGPRWQASGLDPARFFSWLDTSDGTRDAATGRPPVELLPWSSMQLVVWAPSWQDRIGFAGPSLLSQALALLVLWLLWRIVRTISTTEVFTAANARRMVGVGLAVAIGGSAVQLIGYIAQRDIVARSAAARVLDAAFSFSFAPMLVGAIVLVLAEVFRHGVALRAEVDGLV
jgi:hypothetical protein